MAINQPRRDILKIWRVTLTMAAIPPAFLCSFLLEPGGALWLAVTAAWVLLFLLLYLVWLPLYYRGLSFSLEDHAIRLRSGVLFRKTALMPFGAIQFVSVLARPVERLFGLCTLRIVAAGARMSLPGMSRADAEALTALLAGKRGERR